MGRITNLVCACLVVLVPLVLAASWDEDEDTAYNRDAALDIFSNLQRRNDNWMCSRWGDYCKPDAKLKFAACCPGLRCMCGHFWTQGKCQCKSKAQFGRR